jgi:hypothetical protein
MIKSWVSMLSRRNLARAQVYRSAVFRPLFTYLAGDVEWRNPAGLGQMSSAEFDLSRPSRRNSECPLSKRERPLMARTWVTSRSIADLKRPMSDVCN